jgi:hypothetical protein
MQEPEIIESKRWRHTSGATASLYGAVPYARDAAAEGWTLETVGFSLRYPDGTIGGGHPPAATREEAEARLQRWRDRQAEYAEARARG